MTCLTERKTCGKHCKKAYTDTSGRIIKLAVGQLIKIVRMLIEHWAQYALVTRPNGKVTKNGVKLLSHGKACLEIASGWFAKYLGRSLGEIQTVI